MNKYDPKYLDEDEKDLIESINELDVSNIKPPTKIEQRKFKAAANRYINKETKMNIRIDPEELEKIKKQAAKEGLRYQTFIKSILHKYISGKLIEKNKIAG